MVNKKYAVYRNILFICVPAIVLLFMSWCSFIYPMNVNADANCFMSGARYMMQGDVLYKDFFEQKGPFIYWLHVLGWLFTPGSFHGIYIFEVIASCFYFKYVYKTLNVLYDRPFSNTIITIAACSLSYLTSAMNYGDELEEFFLPMYAYIAYQTTLYIFKKDSIRKSKFFITGIFAGIIFWSKYVALTLFLVEIIIVSMCAMKRKDHKFLQNMFLYGLLGFVAVTVPVVLYFIMTGSFSDMIDVYFIANIFEYHTKASDTNIVIIAFGSFLTLILTCVCVYYFFERRENTSHVMFVKKTLIAYGIFAVIHLSFKSLFPYYMMPSNVYNGVFLAFIWYDMLCNKRMFKCIFAVAMITLSIGCNVLTSASDIYKMRCDAIKSVSEKIGTCDNFYFMPNMDYGFYLAMNYLPDRYYFTAVSARDHIICKEFNDSVANGEFDYFLLDMCYGVSIPDRDTLDVINSEYAEYGYTCEVIFDGKDEILCLYKKTE